MAKSHLPVARAVFDVATGQVLRPPAPRGISSYRTRVDSEGVEVEV